MFVIMKLTAQPVSRGYRARVAWKVGVYYFLTTGPLMYFLQVRGRDREAKVSDYYDQRARWEGAVVQNHD